MTPLTAPTVHTVAVPGARLHCEVRGAGPLLLVVGSPMAFAGIRAVRRRTGRRPHRRHLRPARPRPQHDRQPRRRRHAPNSGPTTSSRILDALGAESADVFGSSGGAVTGLALVTRHPARVRTLVAHEPPLLELLPDADQQRAATEDIIGTFHSDGMGAAWAKFMVNAGFDMTAPDDDAAPAHAEMPEPSEQDLREAARFFDHELRPTTRYVPDVDALTGRAGGDRHRRRLEAPADLPDFGRAGRAARRHTGRVPRRSRRIPRASQPNSLTCCVGVGPVTSNDLVR